MRTPRPLLALVAAAAAVVLAGCGGTTGTSAGAAPSAAVTATGGSSTGSGDVLTFPADYGVPDLVPPEGADVVPASGADDGYVAYDVSGVDEADALATFGDQLRAAGFEVVGSSDEQLGSTLQAGKEGAATVTVVPGTDGVLVDVQPPS